MKKTPLEQIKVLAHTLAEKKGSNIVAIDVKGISSITDYILIADGNVDRHVMALAKEITEKMREEGEKPSVIEGAEEGDWIVLEISWTPGCS